MQRPTTNAGGSSGPIATFEIEGGTLNFPAVFAKSDLSVSGPAKAVSELVEFSIL